MKKKELIERIAKEAGVPKSEAQKHFEAFEEVVTETLKAGEEVKIAAQKVPSFSAGNALKEAV